MSRIKLDADAVGLSSIMEKITHVHVKDSFRDGDTVYFVVAPGELGKAVGKGGMMVKQVQQELGKRIKVMEYRDNVVDFIKNIIYPLAVEQIVEENGQIVLKDANKKTKSLLIGRDGKNLLLINRAVQRFFNKEVKVV